MSPESEKDSLSYGLSGYLILGLIVVSHFVI